MNHELIENALQANIALLHKMAQQIAELTAQADTAIKEGRVNEAIGTLISIRGDVSNTSDMIDNTLFVNKVYIS